MAIAVLIGSALGLTIGAVLEVVVKPRLPAITYGASFVLPVTGVVLILFGNFEEQVDTFLTGLVLGYAVIYGWVPYARQIARRRDRDRVERGSDRP